MTLIPGGWIATLDNGVEVRVGFNEAIFGAELNDQTYWLVPSFNVPTELVSGTIPVGVDGAMPPRFAYVVAWRREMVESMEDAAVTEELAKLNGVKT